MPLPGWPQDSTADPTLALARTIDARLKSLEAVAVKVVGSDHLTATTSNSGQTLYTASGNSAVRVSVYHVCTVAGAAGSLATTVTWKDDAGVSRSGKPAADILLTGTNFDKGSFIVNVQGNQSVAYSTTVTGGVGPPTYEVWIVVEKLL